MNKKIVSLLLVCSLALSTSIPVFADSSIDDKQIDKSYTQVEQKKNISYIGENKLVSWEVGDTIYVEQYDLQNNLIETCIGNRNNGEIVSISNGTTNKFNARDIVDLLSSTPLPSPYSFKKVGTFPVYNRVTLDRQTMYLYEDTGSAIHTTYSIRSFSGTIATLAIGIATGMAIPSTISNKLIASIIAAGLATVIGDTLNIGTKITLAADKYELEYYGKDSKTGKKSDIYDQTDKYVITDEESNKIDEVYYDGSCYYDPDDDIPTFKLTQYIVPNLYGIDYEWDRW